MERASKGEKVGENSGNVRGLLGVSQEGLQVLSFSASMSVLGVRLADLDPDPDTGVCI